MEVGVEFDVQSDGRGGSGGLRRELEGGGRGDEDGLLGRRGNRGRCCCGARERRREGNERAIGESEIERGDRVEILRCMHSMDPTRSEDEQ